MISIKRAGGTVMSVDLIQAMVESFRIHGKAELDMSDSKEDKVVATVTAYKVNCNLCGTSRHKAEDCPQHHKIKCKHCG